MKTLVRLFALLLPFAPLALRAQTTGNPGVIGVGANCDLHGFLPGDSTSPERQVVANYPVSSYNGAFHTALGGVHLHIDWAGALYGPSGIPYNCVDQTTAPFVPVAMVQYPLDSDKTLYPFSPSMAVESGFPACPYDPRGGSARPPGTPPNGNPTDYSDHHALAVTRDGWNYETWTTSYCGGKFQASNGSVWDMTEYQRRPYSMTSADAAGLPLFPYLAKYDEVATPRCNTPLNGGTVPTVCHALRMTFQSICGAGYYNGDDVPAFAAPATHGAPGSSNANCYLFEGGRLVLRPDYPTAGFSAANQVLLNTMMTYGFSINDAGSNFYISGTADARWDTNDLLTLQAITGNDLILLDWGHPLYNEAQPPQSAQPAGLQLVPSGTAPANHALAASSTLIVQGGPVTLTWPASTGQSYEYVENGLPSRTGAETFTPQSSACYTLNSRNLFGTATSAPVCVTVLVPPVQGITALKGKR